MLFIIFLLVFSTAVPIILFYCNDNVVTINVVLVVNNIVVWSLCVLIVLIFLFVTNAFFMFISLILVSFVGFVIV